MIGLTVVAAALGAAAAHVHARNERVETIWNCKDKDGRTILTNLQSDTVGKSCRVVHEQRITVIPSPATRGAKTPSPRDFPRESSAERAAARERQRQTLEHELTQEESLLAEARRKLAEQEAVRSGNEKNYARVLERLRPYRDAVDVHTKNIEALKRELANLYR